MENHLKYRTSRALNGIWLGEAPRIMSESDIYCQQLKLFALLSNIFQIARIAPHLLWYRRPELAFHIEFQCECVWTKELD